MKKSILNVSLDAGHHGPRNNTGHDSTFLILKSDIIENSRIELTGIVLPLPSNQIKVTFIIIVPFYLVHFVIFSCFT